MDEHWMPISEMCSVCSPEISYDFVIKFENLEKEEKYFLERLELDKTVLKQWENKNEAVNFSTSEVTIDLCERHFYNKKFSKLN